MPAVRVSVWGLCLAAGLALAACRDRPAAPPDPGAHNPTAVLGSYGPAQSARIAPPLTDAHGRVIPRPAPAPGVAAEVARSGDETALAVWTRDGRVLAAAYAPGTGWSEGVALEQIHGQASDPQLAANGQGSAMAVWRHTVGSIQSLRFSRFHAATGWSEPDVLPGALPRPHLASRGGDANAPQLEMDERGNVVATWPSGFAAGEVQTARYTEGEGWSRAVGEPVTSALR